MIVVWLLAVIAYGVYAGLAIATTSIATKAWVATGFVAVSVAVWLTLHHIDRKRRR